MRVALQHAKAVCDIRIDNRCGKTRVIVKLVHRNWLAVLKPTAHAQMSLVGAKCELPDLSAEGNSERSGLSPPPPTLGQQRENYRSNRRARADQSGNQRLPMVYKVHGGYPDGHPATLA